MGPPHGGRRRAVPAVCIHRRLMARRKPSTRHTSRRASPRPAAAAPRRPARPRVVAKAGALTVTEVAELEELRRELERVSTAPLRWNANPDEVQKSVAHLVLTLVEFIRRRSEERRVGKECRSRWSTQR